ncbi:N-acetylmuramic acid/N-acetylglucosamine kinase [Thalassocella blandensis]|nr:N-acetylmuramic acid/N-acetylglucosamine kinase [Thalassocella blandensis]
MYLGVDGGGTKTAFTLVSDTGAIAGHYVDSTCYHIDVGMNTARDIIHRGIAEVFNQASIDKSALTYAFFGLPAFGEDSSTIQALQALPLGALDAGQYSCDNDMVNGWAAGFGGKDGINIVAGTGSIAYGKRKTLSARSGGWGDLFGDEGSAYWIGRQGLQAFSKMSDHRQPKSRLYTLVKEFFSVEEDLEISGIVLNQWQGQRSKIAELSKVVHAAALQDDAIAKQILSDAGQELANIVAACCDRLAYSPAEKVSISYSGGVFRAENLVFNAFRKTLQELIPHHDICPPMYSPDVGAAIYASLLNGTEISEKSLINLRIPHTSQA